MNVEPLVTIERDRLHAALMRTGVLGVDERGIVSNADRSTRLSVQVAHHLFEQLLQRANLLDEIAAAQ